MSRRVVKRVAEMGLDLLGVVNRTIVNVWSYRHTGGELNIRSRLTMTLSMLTRMASNLSIIISRNDQIYSLPKSDDILITLNRRNTENTSNPKLSAGDYFIKLVYPVSQTISYIIRLFSTPETSTSQTPEPAQPTAETAESTQPTQPAVSTPSVEKYALIVAVSDYRHISDLSYCDEDAVAWMDFLTPLGYKITLLGDDTSTYGKYKKDGLALESNIKAHMARIANLVKSGDKFAYILSGHGDGDKKGSSYYCCLDINGRPEGKYMDTELAADLKRVVDKNVESIVFYDCCFSGGMLPETANVNRSLVCATSTCTEDGYGYDVGRYKQGAWTYHFLVKNLSQNPNDTMAQTFEKAIKTYPYGNGDAPQIMGNTGIKF